MKKVPVSVVQGEADEIAKLAGVTRERALSALVTMYQSLDIEIDLNTTVNKSVEPADLATTQILPKRTA